MEWLRTGQVAKAAGVSIQTLRFYEREGILVAPRRSRSGYRLYTADAVRVIRLVKRAQELGFTLREVRDVLRLRPPRRKEAVVAAAEAKVSEIEERIRALTLMKKTLKKLLKNCDDDDCAILALDSSKSGD
jgi:MerR family transcriptional regulator, mercuric resistance operon regulatory protein